MEQPGHLYFEGFFLHPSQIVSVFALGCELSVAHDASAIVVREGVFHSQTGSDFKLLYLYMRLDVLRMLAYQFLGLQWFSGLGPK